MIVPYKSYQLYPKVGDVYLWRDEFVWNMPVRYNSAAVRFFTGHINHTSYVSAHPKTGELYLFEAKADGHKGNPLTPELLKRKNSYLVHLRDTRPFDEQLFVERVWAKKDCKYDYMNLIFQQPFYRISLALGKPLWIGDVGNSQGIRLQCAEAYAWAKGRDEFWKYSTMEIYKDPLERTLFDEVALVYPDKPKFNRANYL